jgi:hypothetical protein
MAEKGAEGGRFRELEDLDPGFTVTVEDDDPRAAMSRAYSGFAGRPRWRLEIVV